MQKIRKGDKVVVLAGKDKGRSGEVLAVMPKETVRLSGSEHGQAPPAPDPDPGSRHHYQQGSCLHLSNLAIADPKDGKPTRVGFRIEGEKKVRVASVREK
jgi:large subunit ribosomal protein L24